MSHKTIVRTISLHLLYVNNHGCDWRLLHLRVTFEALCLLQDLPRQEVWMTAYLHRTCKITLGTKNTLSCTRLCLTVLNFEECKLITGRLPTPTKRRTQRTTLAGRWEREADGSRHQHDWTTIRSTCTDQAERQVGCQLPSQGLAPGQSKTARPKKNFKL